MITEKMFADKVAECKRRMEMEKIAIIGEKKLPYGTQILTESEEYELVKVNLYLSKKGISYVLSTKKASISDKINEILSDITNQMVKVEECYVGTDESGKGDYFGPLVIAAFISNGKLDDYLLKQGIRDCKKLSDEMVRKYAKLLLSQYAQCCTILSIEPRKYNELHGKYMLEGKTLNALLTFAHSRVITISKEKEPQIQLAITDQFAEEKMIRKEINGTKEVRILPKAEKYVAVAAASILARYTYLEWIEKTSNELGLMFPKGCGNDVKFVASTLITKIGKENLIQYAKIHFKTTNEIMKGYYANEKYLYL